MFRRCKILICLLSLLLCVSVLTGCDSETNTSTTQRVYYTSEELVENLEIEYAITKENVLIGIVKNNNPIDVSVKINVEFYDDNGNVIATKESLNTALGQNKEAVLLFDFAPCSFASYNQKEITAKQSVFKTYYDKISVSDYEDDRRINVEIKNEAEDEIFFLETGVVFYHEGTIVGYRNQFKTSTAANETAEFNFSRLLYPFDSYKVFVNDAH